MKFHKWDNNTAMSTSTLIKKQVTSTPEAHLPYFLLGKQSPRVITVLTSNSPK